MTSRFLGISEALAGACVFFLARPACLAQSSFQVRILPLGDSITESGTPPGLPAGVQYKSYRYWLWKDLGADGYDSSTVNFVGHRYGTATGPVGDFDFDQDHEGYSGFSTHDILAWVPIWHDPKIHDVVLLHLGSNNIFHSHESADDIARSLGDVIDHLRGVDPDTPVNTAIFIAQIIPIGPNLYGFDVASTNARIGQLNTKIPPLAADKTATVPTSPVVVVDQNTNFPASTETWDGVHPKDEGDRRMASKWYLALKHASPAVLPTPPSLHAFGGGTAACDGSLPVLSAPQPAHVGQAFRLECTVGSPAATGVGLVADVPDLSGADLYAGQATVLVDRGLSTLSQTFTVTNNGSGKGIADFTLPSGFDVAGSCLHFQVVWQWPAGACPAGTTTFYSSSNGLTAVVQ